MDRPGPQTAAAAGLSSCHVCSKLAPADVHTCPRCESPVHQRKPDSLQRMWALLAASIILYIPANLAPIMSIEKLGTAAPSTIIGGVFELWMHGSYPIAIVIFVASVLVPVGKILALIYLGYSVQRPSHNTLVARTKLYRITEFIGRWSMVDVFVVAVLVALVQIGSIMTITPGSAAVAFAGVVVLTMLAAESFDPRLMWDAAYNEEKRNRNDAKQG